MITWWDALSIERQIFYGIAILATLTLGIQLLLTVLGGIDADDGGGGLGHDVGAGAADAHAAGAHHGDTLGGLKLVSSRTIVAFFFGFGWSGVIALRRGLPLGAAVAIGIVVGGTMLVLLALLIRALLGLRSSGTLDYRNAVGQTATVYVTIPAGRGGVGQVEVLVQGRLQTVRAMTAQAAPLAPQAKVKITGLIDAQTLEVEPL
ncbi:MAG TPA: hypothetical protein PLU30_03465 [Verrucomicrobiae bacterium]|nr:hypothetical protein [Verrucomicrobiae bacterium]